MSKGSKPRPIPKYREFLDNFDQINWNDDLISCWECGQPYKKKDRDKYMKLDATRDWVCKQCNFN